MSGRSSIISKLLTDLISLTTWRAHRMNMTHLQTIAGGVSLGYSRFLCLPDFFIAETKCSLYFVAASVGASQKNCFVFSRDDSPNITVRKCRSKHRSKAEFSVIPSNVRTHNLVMRTYRSIVPITGRRS